MYGDAIKLKIVGAQVSTILHGAFEKRSGFKLYVNAFCLFYGASVPAFRRGFLLVATSTVRACGPILGASLWFLDRQHVWFRD